jgi:GNAT superfamily N-acetyltransferase
VRSKFRDAERKLLRVYYDDWNVPFCGRLAGWRADSPIYVLRRGALVGGVYLCDKNEFGDEPSFGQLHYPFVASSERGKGIYSILFAQLVERARLWGLDGVIITLLLTPDRLFQVPMYQRWGAVEERRMRPPMILPAIVPVPLRLLARRLRRVAMDAWQLYVAPPCD